MLATRNEPKGCEVSNQFSLLEPQEEDEDSPPGLTDSEDEEERKARDQQLRSSIHTKLIESGEYDK